MSSKPPHPQPSAFTGNPFAHHPQPTAARVVEVRPPVPRTAPCLIVSKARQTRIQKTMVAALRLKDGQLLSLHAPERRGDVWLLDTHPRVGRPFRLYGRDGDGRFTRTCEIGDEQMLPGRRWPHQVVPATLRLALGPEHLPTEDSPRGIFVLTPVV